MSSTDVSALFSAAGADGTLSKGALAVLDAEDMGAVINQGLGITPDQVTASETFNVVLLLDDSSSMFHRAKSGGPNNVELTREGYNLILDSLLKTKQTDGIIFSARALNRGQICPSVLIKDAPRLDASNFDAGGGTPLYDEATVTLGMATAKHQQFADNGVPMHTVVAFISDGADYGSRKQRASHVKTIVNDLLRTESFIVIGLGIDDSELDAQGNVIRKGTDFKHIFNEMGIDDRWILTPGNSPSEIRKAFAMVSQSVSRASQNAGAFSKTAMGGFGA